MSALTTFYKSIFQKDASKDTPGFGTFVGVFVPCILMLFGVIIFLRLGWITGQVGLFTTLTIISLSALITLLTSLSMAAIATNIELGKGGVYYILSRSLGIEVGSALGFPLFIKQSLSVAFCIVGFSESLHDLIPEWTITSIGIWTLIIFTICACASLSGALKLQVAIFVALVASLISFFAGGELAPANPDAYEPASPLSLGFWGIFAIFFPAMTGMESSVSLSGDLKNPSKSLPLGTIGALLVAYVIYMLIPIFLVWHVPMDRLKYDPLVMQDVAVIPSLIVVGIWAATLSSALGGILGAPRTLQAMSDDKVMPAIFSRTYGRKQEPIIATLATFSLALISIYFGSVNKIAPVLSMICLICYGVLNLCAGMETLMGNPSWRPRFSVHWSLSFLGAFLCLLAMLMIDAGDALLAFGFVALLFFLTKRRHLQASWENINQGILHFISRMTIYRLAYNEEGSKSWRPHFLVFTKKPEEHTHSLMRFSQAISQSKSFLTMASFLPTPIACEKTKRSLGLDFSKKLQEKNIDAMVQLSHAEKITDGMEQIIEHYGFGPLIPNTVVFGGVQENSVDFAKVIQTAYLKHYNIIILNDKKALQDHVGGDIHVWWDNENQNNGDFMLVLAYMLQRNPIWKKTRICLNGIVNNELKRQSMLTEFRNQSLKRRLPLNVQVFVAANPETESNELISAFSRDASLIFKAIRPPEDSLEAYASYLKTVFEATDAFPGTALVISSEHTRFENILK